MRKITHADIASLIQLQKRIYRNKFVSLWADSSDQEIFETFTWCLDGLTIDQLSRGMERMKTESWPPLVTDFKIWCEQGSQWLTEHEAWANALAFIANPKTMITSQAYDALQKVNQILREEGQKSAVRPFKDIYVRLVNDCKAQSIEQSKYVPKVRKAIEQQPIEAAPCPSHLLDKLKTSFRVI